MVKKVAAVALILLTSGAWFYLDHLNKQEQFAAEQTRKAMQQARAEARARFESMLRSDLSNCKVAAEKTRNDYLLLKQKPVPRKPGEFTIPQSVADEAAKMLSDANEGCQLTYDTRMTHGW